MSSFRSIWSGVKRWTSSLFSRSQSESESDLRERLDQRIEAQMRKAEGVEKLRKELHRAQSDVKDLSGQVAELRRTSNRDLSNVSGRLDDLKELVRRLGATLAAKEQELEQIEAAADRLSTRRLVTTISAAAMSAMLAPAFLVASLWTFGGPIPSILTKEKRMSQKEIEAIDSGKTLQRARENLSRADSVRLERLIQESR
jgi:light-regulated signal transduction histidine kinase (bacteriophytochrome)